MNKIDWAARKERARAFVRQERKKHQTSWASLQYEYETEQDDEINQSSAAPDRVAQDSAGAGGSSNGTASKLDSDGAAVRDGTLSLVSQGTTG